MNTSSDKVHNPPPPDPVAVLGGRSGVTFLVFVENNVIITGHADGKIQEWSLPIRRSINSWPGHSDSVLWLAILHDHLISQSRDGLVKLWSKTHAGKESQWTLQAQISSAPHTFCNSATVIFSQNIIYLTTPSDQTSYINCHRINTSSIPQSDNSITTTSVSISNSPGFTLKPKCVKDYGMCMKMCNTNPITHDVSTGYLLVGYESGNIALWNITSVEMVHTLRIHSDSVMCMNVWTSSANGQLMGFSGSVDNVIKSWTISNNVLVLHDNSVTVINKGFNDVAIRGDGKIFATGGWDCNGRVFGTKKLRPLAVLTYHKESVSCVRFSDDHMLALASKDGYITLWDIYKGV